MRDFLIRLSDAYRAVAAIMRGGSVMYRCKIQGGGETRVIFERKAFVSRCEFSGCFTEVDMAGLRGVNAFDAGGDRK